MSKKELTSDELLAQFDTLGGDDLPAAAPPSKASASRPANTPQTAEDDPLAELENLAKAKPASRPNTPRLSSNRSSKRPDVATPSSSARTSEDRPQGVTVPRKSGESIRSFHQAYTPGSSADSGESELKAQPAPEPAKQQGGGWWGGLLSTATAVRKQVEAGVSQIQKNEEAQKYLEQVRGRVGDLRGIGGELRSRALPTFTSIIHTLAPPISAHERLQIHITHDLVGYPSLDPLIYSTFSRVMAQVEGGDLLVIQRGSESSQRRSSEIGFSGGSTSGWNDGPWWRQADEKRELNIVKGLPEGTKLARVSAESYANEYFASRGGVEEAAKQATEVLSESNPVRSSDIFLAIQAVQQPFPEELFGGAQEEKKEEATGGVEEPKDADDLVSFAIYLHDPIHSISFKTVTQAFPLKWAEWIDAASPQEGFPPQIIEIIESGGVDPREWVSEWIEEVLGLGVGVVAQRYVARRMGVGEGGIGRGKAREEAIESNASEAARAGLI